MEGVLVRERAYGGGGGVSKGEGIGRWRGC